jgi:sugar lactone lactonase YvrE
MKTSNLSWQKMAIILSVMVLSVVINGCKKDYTKDLHNAYVDGIPNPPPTVAIPVMNTIQPSGALPNSVISILGYNFDPLFSNNTITINGIPATINSISPLLLNGAPVVTVNSIQIKEILVTVPANATTGPIILKSGATVLTSTTNLTVTSGTVTTFKDLGTITLRHIIIDASGNIFGDDGAKSIYKIAVGGTVSLVAGGANSSTFKSIWGIVIDALGNLYVPDRGNYNIFRITPEGIVSSLAGNGTEGIMDGAGNAARLSVPTGIAIDQSNNLYVTDMHRVRKISNVGLVTTIAGSATDGSIDGTGATAQFGTLEGIAVDADKNVYVSDTKYKKIRKITPDGVVTTLAGSGTQGFADGPGTAAQFNNPHGLAVDAAGNVFVSDENYLLPMYSIRMVNRLGVVTTLLSGTSNTGVINGPLATASTNFPDGMTIDVLGNLYIANTGANTISKVTIK